MPAPNNSFFLCCTPRNTGYVHLGRFHELNNAVGLRFTQCIISNLIQKNVSGQNAFPFCQKLKCFPGVNNSVLIPMLLSSPRNTHISKWRNWGCITQLVTSTVLINRDSKDLKSSVMMTGGQMSFKCCQSQSLTHVAPTICRHYAGV